MVSIPQSELHNRRTALIDSIPEYGIIILFGNEDVTRNADTEFKFRQYSDFWYFTGINEANACYVVKKTPEGVFERLYVLPRNPEMEIWTGYRLGIEGAREVSGIQEVYENIQLVEDEQWFLSQVKYVYLDVYEKSQRAHRMRLSQAYLDTERRGLNEHVQGIYKTQLLTQALRLKKSQWEIEMMQKSVDICIEAHIQMAQQASARVKKGEVLTESQMMADFLHHGYTHGADWSYMPIMAGGENACILHYVDNDKTVKSGDLVLVDAGVEYGYYASDITRTYPISGTFRPAQKAIYELVLKANVACIELAGQDSVTTGDIHQKAIAILTQGLIDLGIIQMSFAEAIETKAYFQYYPHGTGHYIGLDVHDVGPYRTMEGERVAGPWEEGMAITIEPGLYFGKFTEAPDEFRGIGVRIEDNIVKTSDGVINLTQAMPKRVPEIEELMK